MPWVCSGPNKLRSILLIILITGLPEFCWDIAYIKLLNFSFIDANSINIVFSNSDLLSLFLSSIISTICSTVFSMSWELITLCSSLLFEVIVSSCSVEGFSTLDESISSSFSLLVDSTSSFEIESSSLATSKSWLFSSNESSWYSSLVSEISIDSIISSFSSSINSFSFSLDFSESTISLILSSLTCGSEVSITNSLLFSSSNIYSSFESNASTVSDSSNSSEWSSNRSSVNNSFDSFSPRDKFLLSLTSCCISSRLSKPSKNDCSSSNSEESDFISSFASSNGSSFEFSFKFSSEYEDVNVSSYISTSLFSSSNTYSSFESDASTISDSSSCSRFVSCSSLISSTISSDSIFDSICSLTLADSTLGEIFSLLSAFNSLSLIVSTLEKSKI